MAKKNVNASKTENNKIYLELTSGVGGIEAGLFTHTMLEMYTKLFELKDWRFQILNSTEIAPKALKTCLLEVEGPEVYQTMRFEIGCHRVQRVPETCRLGKIQTSVSKVTVMPKTDEIGFFVFLHF